MRVFLLLLAMSSVTLAQLDDKCYRSTHPRGVGTIPSDCPAGQVKWGLWCYEPCKAGRHGVGHNCYQDGATGYGRGAGKMTFGQCAEDEEKGWGLWCYPKCEENYTGVGPMCWQKNAYGAVSRPEGTTFTCAPGEENDTGLCYPVCPENMHGVGPVCWQNCEAINMHKCGFQCLKNDTSCTAEIQKQAGDFVELFGNVFSLAGGKLTWEKVKKDGMEVVKDVGAGICEDPKSLAKLQSRRLLTTPAYE